ncbi:MAG: multidrug efflux SMR transporter [Pseudomonadota bacterium]
MAYIFLALAIVAEVAATSALKASEEFTKLVPSLIVAIGYGISFYCLSVVIKTIPLGIAYAVWAGVGIVLISLVGVFFYRQILDIPAIVGMVLIIVGVVVIYGFSDVVESA